MTYAKIGLIWISSSRRVASLATERAASRPVQFPTNRRFSKTGDLWIQSIRRIITILVRSRSRFPKRLTSNDSSLCLSIRFQNVCQSLLLDWICKFLTDQCVFVTMGYFLRVFNISDLSLSGGTPFNMRGSWPLAVNPGPQSNCAANKMKFARTKVLPHKITWSIIEIEVCEFDLPVG